MRLLTSKQLCNLSGAGQAMADTCALAAASALFLGHPLMGAAIGV